MEAKFDSDVTIQSQYSASPRINSLIDGFAGLINPKPDIDLLFQNYVDIDTAAGVGLDNWGLIVDLDRVQQNITLDDPTYRTFLKIKMVANISDVTLRDLNVIMSKIFEGRGKAYALEIGVMWIRYIFDFDLSLLEQTILRDEAILPRPGCVGFEIGYIIPEADILGFNGQELMNFNNGIFGG